MNDKLNYTNLSYSEIKDGLVSRMAQDPRFSNFTESQLNTVLLEIFTATTDFTNYYIGRRAEESFLDSAKLRSSVIMLSKMLGYVVQRPIPATTSIKIKLKSGTLGQTFSLAAGKTFTFNGLNYILKDTISYTITQDDVNNFATNPEYVLVLEFYDKNQKGILKHTEQIADSDKVPVYLIQGDIKLYDVAPTDNPKLNTRFQTYKILDKDFSNMFGSEDYGYDNTNGTTEVTYNLTRVGVGDSLVQAFSQTAGESSFNNSGEFYIDRRSFLNDSTFPALTARGSGSNSKYCVIRTAIDDNVEVLFADDNIGKIGPKDLQHLYVKYLSTKGAAGNQVGVINKIITSQEISFQDFNQSNVEFTLRKNITGGADRESIDSMKVNAPGIFYSLDRCVSSKDYVNFLKTLTSPLNVKNAIAWGEQEETVDGNVSNLRMFNVVLFSILGEMYHKEYINGELVYNRLSTDADSYKLMADNDYFDLLVAGDSVTPLRDDAFDEFEDVGLVYSKLKPRSQATVKNVYISPIIKDLKIAGYVYLNPLADRIKTNAKITDALYEYLNDNADFNIPVYISNLIQLIEEFPEVHHADIKLVSNDTNYVDLESMYITTDAMSLSSVSGTYDSDYISKIYNEQQNVRSISNPQIISSKDIYASAISEYISEYSANTQSVILSLLPELETKTYKLDPSKNGNNKFVRTEIVWPSNNLWNKKYCRVGLSTDTPEELIQNFTPSERNFYMGIMKCVYDKLKAISTNASTSTSMIDLAEKYLTNTNNCFGCSLKTLSLNNNGSAADPLEIKDFIETKFPLIVDLFRNSFINDIQNDLLDSYYNAVNYSMKNEIVRITAPESNQYVYAR